MEYILECMSISVKGMLGTVFWVITLAIMISVIAIIGFLISGEWRSNYKTRKHSRQKYNGEKILIKGGKDE